MIILEHPIFLSLFPVMCMAIYLRHFWPQRGMRVPFSFDAVQQPLRAPTFFPRLCAVLALSAHWLAWIMLIVALAGPNLIDQEKVFLSRGLDIMIVLDESPSMAAQDTQLRSRFAAAKTVVKDFILQRENDAIGLVSFSSEGFLRVPPTLDYTHVINVLQDLDITAMESGTAIGMGLLLASLHLSSSSHSEKVIILLTDGVNTAGEITPDTAAEIAKQLNIRIYAIGIGSRQETLFEYRDTESDLLYRGTVRDNFDEQLLIGLSQQSGGAYFGVSDFESLQTVFDAIDSAETLEQQVRIDVKANPIYHYFIISMLILFAFDFLIRKLLLREGGL